MTEAALKLAEKQESIKKVVSRKLKQDPKPYFLDDGGMRAYYIGFARFMVSLYNVLFIVPAIAVGVLEAISAGFLQGAKRVVRSYEGRLGK